MPTLAAILFCFAALLTVLFAPLTSSLSGSSGLIATGASIGIIVVSLIRAAVMILAMLCVTRGGTAAVAIAAVLLMEIASCAVHFATASVNNSIPSQYGLQALATLLPALLIVAGFLLGFNSPLAPKILWTAAILSTGVAGFGFIGVKSAAASHMLEIEALNRDLAAKAEKRKADLNAIPTSAGVEPLLPFTLLAEPDDVRSLANQRIIAADNAVEQLKAALDGPNAEAARLIIKDVELAVSRKKKEAEVNAIPPAAGLAGMLSHYTPGEDGQARGLVEDRLHATPDAEAQLVKALAGPHALEAIDLMRRIDKYRLEPSTYDAAFTAAAEIAARLNAANRPPEPQIKALAEAVGHMAERCGDELLKKHRQELMAVYEMSRRAEKQYGYGAHYMDLELALGLR
jgi:hypothetical protein